MKKRKIKQTKFFKIGILFLGLSLLIWNCDNQEIIQIDELSQNNLTVLENQKDSVNFLVVGLSKKIEDYNKKKNTKNLFYKKYKPN